MRMDIDAKNVKIKKLKKNKQLTFVTLEKQAVVMTLTVLASFLWHKQKDLKSWAENKNDNQIQWIRLIVSTHQMFLL